MKKRNPFIFDHLFILYQCKIISFVRIVGEWKRINLLMYWKLPINQPNKQPTKQTFFKTLKGCSNDFIFQKIIWVNSFSSLRTLFEKLFKFWIFKFWNPFNGDNFFESLFFFRFFENAPVSIKCYIWIEYQTELQFITFKQITKENWHTNIGNTTNLTFRFTLLQKERKKWVHIHKRISFFRCIFRTSRKKLRCSASSRGVLSTKHRTGTCPAIFIKGALLIRSVVCISDQNDTTLKKHV